MRRGRCLSGRRLLVGCMLVWCALTGRAAQAHVASTGFLDIEAHGRTLAGSVELSVRDIELAIGVDADGDGRVTWGELRAAEPRLVRYLAGHFSLAADGAECPIQFGRLEVNSRVDGNYAWLPFNAHCIHDATALEIRYHVLAGIDSSHRGLLRLAAGAVVQAAVLDPAGAAATLAPTRAAPWRAFAQYFQAGVGHIWSGIDHLLFLMSLLLPAVLSRHGGRWEPVAAAKPACVSILKVVTAFTLAHSITLSLAALDVLRLPARLTESVIAASIVVAALNNIFPLVTEARARIAFAFGLLHGFGFASVLTEMGLPAGARLISLLAFNCGIETGQLAVVLAVMPMVYGLRRLEVYRRALLPWGSGAIATVALGWLAQRAMG
jgi:HupE / UreJ protein